MPSRKVLLYVDDCESVSLLVRRFFARKYPQYEIVLAANADDALRELEQRRDTPNAVDALVSDMRLGPGMDGPALLQRVQEAFPRLRRILVTGLLGPAEKKRGLAVGAHAVIEKDLNAQQFVNRLYDLTEAPTEAIEAEN